MRHMVWFLVAGAVGCAPRPRPSVVARAGAVPRVAACENPRVPATFMLVDGRELTCEELQAIPEGRVLRVDVINGRDAVAIYGQRAAHGAVLVTLTKP